jgi:hypothetical protein
LLLGVTALLSIVTIALALFALSSRSWVQWFLVVGSWSTTAITAFLLKLSAGHWDRYEELLEALFLYDGG